MLEPCTLSPLAWLISILAWLTALLSLGCAVYWLIVAAQVVRTRLLLPTARDGLKLPAVTKSVCIIAPAHNEESTIGKLITSLRAQDHPHWTAVLALDRCTDATRTNALQAADADPRITLLDITDCPPDWAGKVHAVWKAVETSPQAQAADLLLFVDADTAMHPGCVRAAAALLTSRGDHLLSLLSTLETKAWFERLAQLVAGFELTKWYPPLRASRSERRRAFANGQFMLFDAHAYRTIGGHEAVREHLLEDMEFARRISAHNLRSSVLLADGMHQCRMYDDWPAFTRGWKRIYTECANRRPTRLVRASWGLLVTATILPLASLLALVVFPQFWLLGLAGLLGYAVGIGTLLWSSRAPLIAGLCFPVGGILVCRILLQAASDLRKGVPTQWAGRSYIRQPR